jgi:AcrR family transcriptional regulator
MSSAKSTRRGPDDDAPSSAGKRSSVRRRFSAYVADEIESAAISLFAERGYDSVTVEQIAAAAGTSPRTFFRYFGSKDEVLMRDQQRRFERLYEAFLAEPPGPDVRGALHRALLVMAAGDDENADDVAIRSAAIATKPGLVGLDSMSRWSEPIVKLVAERLGIDPNRDPRPQVMVLSALVGVAVGYGMWGNKGFKGSVTPHVERALAALDGLPSPQQPMPPRRRRTSKK